MIDYPSVDGDLTLYDEQCRAEEIGLLVRYVEQGRFLILTNSANRLSRGRVLEANEDWQDAKALAAPFGINYADVPFSSIRARVTGTHPIAGDLFDLVLMAHHGLPLTLQAGEALPEVNRQAAVGLMDYGGAGGQVLALSDLGSPDPYNPREGERDNPDILRNLAGYVRDR